ncbi:MAG: glycosyltransferase family 4 protein [candidate division KSB1 bacterium]|nr:glycosyltransferase family 4 protein [candidate division KSB1 bacterium]
MAPVPEPRFDFRQLRVMVVTNLPNPQRGIHATQTALLADYLEREGAQVRRVTRQTRFILKTVDILCQLWLQRNSYDLIQIQTTPYHGFANTAVVIAAAQLLGKRVVSNYFTSAGPDFLEKHRRWAVPLLKRADAVVVASKYVQDRLASLGVRSVVIPHLVDYTDWPWRERTSLRPALLWVRRFHPECDPVTAIRAFQRIKARHPEASLTMVGDGPLLSPCRRLAQEANLRDVSFPGFVERKTLRGYYETADIFLHTARVDNQPQSLLEAMASGLAVVATRVGGVPELVEDGRCGLLVDPADAEAMAEAVDCLLERPQVALRMIHSARERIRSLDWPHLRPQWSQLYEAVLAGTEPCSKLGDIRTQQSARAPVATRRSEAEVPAMAAGTLQRRRRLSK